MAAGFKYDEVSISNAKKLTEGLKSSFNECGNNIKNIINHFDKPSDMPSIESEENAIRNVVDNFDDRIYEIISSINQIMASVNGTNSTINSGVTSLKDSTSSDFSFYGDFEINQIPTRSEYMLNAKNPLNQMQIGNNKNPNDIQYVNYLIGNALYSGLKNSEMLLANQTLSFRNDSSTNNNTLGMKKLTTFAVNTGTSNLAISSMITNASILDKDLGNMVINNTYKGIINNKFDGNNPGLVNYTNFWIDTSKNDKKADDMLTDLTVLAVSNNKIDGNSASIKRIANYVVKDAKNNKKKRDILTESSINAVGDKNANGDSYIGAKLMEFTIDESRVDKLLRSKLLDKTCDEFGNNKLRSQLDELAFGYLSFVATTDSKVAASFTKSQELYFEKQGFTDADIKRLMSGKISIDELLNEIKNDPNRQSKYDKAQLMSIFVDNEDNASIAKQNRKLIESLENDENFRKIFIDKYLNDYANNNLPNNNYSELALAYINLKSQNNESLKAAFADASIKSLMHSCGIGYVDAQRVYNNEITLNDLFKEINEDQNNDRRKKMYEAGYLAESGFSNIFSMTDLNNLGVSTTKQIKSLQLSNYDEQGRRELAASRILQKMSSGMNLTDAFAKTTVAWQYVDSLGRVQITFDDPHTDRASAGVRKGYKYKALTYSDVFGDKDILKDLKKYDGKNTNVLINASRLFETSSFEVWRNANKNKLTNNNNRIDELTRKLDNINSTYSIIQENVKFDISYIDPYLHSKDKTASSFDANVLNNVKKQMSTSSSKGERGNNVVDINSKDGLVNLITCAANGAVKFDGNNVSIDGKSVRYQSNDLMLNRYGKYIDYLTADEIAALNYTLKTSGVEKAYEYLDSLSNILDRRWSLSMESKYTQKGYDNWLLSSGEGLVLKSVDGINSMVNTAHALMTGQDIKKADVLDRNSLLKSGAHNYMKETYGEKAAYAYDIGSSMAESAVSALLARVGGGGSLMETFVTTINFFPSAYNSAVNNAVDRGLSTEASVAYASFLAASEVVTEAIALDNFLSIGKKVTTSKFNKALASGTALLNQANVEGAEEVVNSLAGALFDDLIAGSQSEYNLNIKEYMNKGYSEKDATTLARKDFANEVKDAGVQGWISGLCFGAFGTTSNAVKTNFIASEIDSALNTPSDQLTWKQKMAIKQFNEYVDTVVNSVSDASNMSVDEVRETLKQKIQTPLIQKTSKEVSPVNTQNKVSLKEKIGSWFSGLSKNTDVNNNQINDVSTNTKDDIVETHQNTTFKSEHNNTKYSDYTLEQIMNSNGEYEEICSMFFDLAKDDDTREKLKGILYDGGYNGFSLASNITNKDNPRLDAQRRINFAYLLIRNPQTFDFFMKNQINLFHGTNGNALPTILKYGLNSLDASQESGIDISTGESWSRIGGKRNFVSFTDMLDIAEGYSTLKSKTGNEELNFEVLICTTKEDVKESGKVTIHSDIPEVGVDNRLPLDRIKAICVPSDKVEYVKKMVGGTIEVLPIDDIESKFYYIDNGGYVLDLNYDKYEKLKDFTSRENKNFDLLENYSLESSDKAPKIILNEADIITENSFGIESKKLTDEALERILKILNSIPVTEINTHISDLDSNIKKQILESFDIEVLTEYVIECLDNELTIENIKKLSLGTNIILLKNMFLNIDKIAAKVSNNPKYGESFADFCKKIPMRSSMYENFLTHPVLSKYLFQNIDAEHFNEIIKHYINEDLNLTINKFLSKIPKEKLYDILDAYTIQEMNEETRKKFEQIYPGLIDSIINKVNLTIEEIIGNPYSDLFKRFQDFENNRLVFGNKKREEYIKQMYEFLIDEKNIIKTNGNIEFYLKIDGLRELLVRNNKIIDIINKKRGRRFCELINTYDEIYEIVDKYSGLFEEYVKEVAKGNIEFKPKHYSDLLNGYRNLNSNEKKEIEPVFFKKYLEDYFNIENIKIYLNKLSELSNLSQKEVHELIDFISTVEIVGLNDLNITLNYNEIYNAINKLILENNSAVDLVHLQSHIYNFTMYFCKLNNIKMEVKFYYEDSKTGGTSSGGLIKFNTKFFNQKFNIDNIFLDKLETIFHESFHEMQVQEANNGVLNQYNLVYTIEKILRNEIGNEYYDNNYFNITYEIDARYNSNVILYNYLKEISPSTFAANSKRIKDTIEKESKLYETNKNILEYDETVLSRDMLLDRIIQKDISLLQQNPILLNIYNEDGTRKNFKELFEAKKSTKDKNIQNMIDYWIRTRSYSLQNFIDELYSYKIMTDDNYDNEIRTLYSQSLSDTKLFETFLLESKYFTDENFEKKVHNIIVELQKNSPDSVEDLNIIEQVIIEVYNDFKQEFSSIPKNLMQMENANILIDLINKKIDDQDFVESIINNCNYDTYLKLINSKELPKEKIVPYLLKKKIYFDILINKNFDKYFDFIADNLLDYIKVDQLHNYISLKQVLALPEEKQEIFKKRYPGVFETLS